MPRIALLVILLSVSLSPIAKAAKQAFSLPQFSQITADQWINTTPLRVEELRGQVILVDVWTFGCWNCYRSIPWLNHLEEKYASQGFMIVGIHTPEFEHEKEREKVMQKCIEFNVTHPVMLDNDFAYWNRLQNRYWPTFYVVDKQGQVQGVFIGETHQGDKRAATVEALIERLLAQ